MIKRNIELETKLINELLDFEPDQQRARSIWRSKRSISMKLCARCAGVAVGEMGGAGHSTGN